MSNASKSGTCSITVSGLGDPQVEALRAVFEQYTPPLAIHSISLQELDNLSDPDSTLLIVDTGFFDQQIQTDPESRILQRGLRCIGLYSATPPNPAELAALVNLRDLVPAEYTKQVIFAAEREIRTMSLERELIRKNSLLKATGKTLPELPEEHTETSGEQTEIAVESDEIQNKWILDRDKFLLHLDEHLHLLHHNNHGALALIEIDHYKAGDPEDPNFRARYMAIVGNIILSRCMQSDVVGFFSRNVFALFSTRYSQQSFSTFAEHLRHTIAESLFEGESEYFQVKCSIGICFWSTHIANTRELVARAQQACTKARMGDGNQVQIYQTLATSFDVLDEQAKYKDQINSALKENRFRLVYQPIVNLKQFGEENYAILLRMIDRSGKNLSPDRFLPIAENTGLINYIDQWVIQQTVELAKRSIKQKKKRNFFIKISGYSLNSEKIIKCLAYYLKTAKIDGQLLVFQVDYAQYINHPERVKAFMEQITPLKCRVAFDHFGFGAFSLNELKQLPVDFIKIDGTFSRGMPGKPAHQKTVEKIQEAATECNIKTIAKSVEDANTLSMLWNLGVDAVQGYFIQEPNESMRFDFMAI